jgi:conjugal transfer/type IV secretion protein DotA/TraY
MSASSDITASTQSGDKFVDFFNQIFGTGWQNIIDGQSPVGGASEPIYLLLSSLGAVVLAGVTALMFYVVIVGAMGTAHEGETLGKRYSTLWTPIRGALSISLLMPLPYVAPKILMIVAIVLKFIYVGITGANYLAVSTVDHMVHQGGAMSTKRAPLPLVENIASEILKNLVAQEYYSEFEELSYGPGVEDTSTSGVKSFVFTPPGQVSAFKPFMGRIKTTCMSVNESICEKENQLGIRLINELRPVAKALINIDTPIDITQERIYRAAIDNYARASQQLATEALNSIGESKKLQTLSQAVKNNGWVWLGSYYGYMTQANENAQKHAQTKITISSAINEKGVLMLGGPEIDGVMERYHNFVAIVDAGRINQQKLMASANDSAGVGALVGSFFADAVGSSIMVSGGNNTALTGAAEIFATTIAQGDPIDKLQTLGHQIINTGTIMITGAMAAKMATEVVDGASAAASVASPLTSKVTSATTDIIAKKLGSLAGGLSSVGLALTLGGIVLAYYIPAVPFILWTTAVINMLILFIELIVASILWAAAHAIPEGEGMAGQHGKQGYMLFMGIMLRPALHVVGFFFAFVVISVVGNYVGESYLDFTAANGQDDEPFGPLGQMVGWLAILFIGGSIMVVATHKTFSLITWLPDNIMKWIGAGATSMNEHNDEQRASHMFAGVVTRAQGAVSGGVSGVMNAAAKNATKDISPTGRPGRPSSNSLTQGDK